MSLRLVRRTCRQPRRHRIATYDGWFAVSEPLLLHANGGLEVLTLGFYVSLGSVFWPFKADPPGVVYTALASLSNEATAFRKLVIQLTPDEDADAIADLELSEADLTIAWEPFNELIAGPRFHGLRDVELHMKYVFDDTEDQIVGDVLEGAIQEIQACLAQHLEKVLWHKQGIMAIRYSIIE